MSTDQKRIKLTQVLRPHKATVNRIAWSPGGECLATSSDDGTLHIFTFSPANTHFSLVGHKSRVHSLAWHPSGKFIFSASHDQTIIAWSIEEKRAVDKAGCHARVLGMHWLLTNNILVTIEEGMVFRYREFDKSSYFLEIEREIHRNPLSYLQWLDGFFLRNEAAISELFELATTTSNRLITAAAISIDNSLCAVAMQEGQILLARKGTTNRILEGHTAKITSLSISHDFRYLASKSVDGTVRLWSLPDGSPLLIIPEPMGSGWRYAGIGFHPTADILATQSRRVGEIRFWDISSIPALIDRKTSTFHVSAKVALVGDSSVGKSCLALRLAEDRYEEQGTTHGMRVWKLPFSSISDEKAPPNEIRTITLWDMGGQDEYRLIHQLFLHDTTVALVLFDPTRGRAAFETVEGWNKSLEKQLSGSKASKILVGTKLDKASDLVDSRAIQKLCEACNFFNYFETSAQTSRGINEMKNALKEIIDWNVLVRTSRPDLFQRISQELERRTTAGEAVILLDEFEEYMRKQLQEQWDRAALDSVVKQLAMQGVIAETKLATGERALVLRVSEIERYAGSLIVAARKNPRNVPSLEAATIISSSMDFPGIPSELRLKPIDERIVLECVVQLLLAHGICFRHQGLLIFPSLFAETLIGEEDNIFGASIYYNFSGAIDNIYSSLIAKLATVDAFGVVRISRGKAHFEKTGQGICGIHNITTREGFAQLDLYFSDDCKEHIRDLFAVFVEEHLRIEGVEIAEELAIACPKGIKLEPRLLRERVLDGKPYVICPSCEIKHAIMSGAQQTKVEKPDVEKRLLALKTKIQRGNQSAISLTQVSWRDQAKRPAGQPLRILHLSDLHFRADTDVRSMFEPLRSDLQDRDEGLGFDYLDYLIISGDLVQTGAAAEFEKALQFVSSLVTAFDLTATRCVVIPGNHDLTWLMPYNYRRKQTRDPEGLKNGTYSIQGEVIAIRDEKKYAERFKAYSDYFYHPFYQEEYPLSSDYQGKAYFFKENRLQILAFNSSTLIDELHPERASIPESMFERVIASASDQIRTYQAESGWKKAEPILTFAVWHHPISGPDSMKDISFMERLRQIGVKACLNGHVHEHRAALFYHFHPKKLHIIGAGSFGAPFIDRPESTPRLYNMIEIDRKFSKIKVHTRALKKAGGAWEGWAEWPGADRFEKRSFYELALDFGR